MVAMLMRAAGLRGEAAHQFVQRYGASVTISWAQFTGRELPNARIRAALPNTELLSGDSFGALTSIGFNRPTGGFHDPTPRDAEMRNVAAHMAAKAFDRIPAELLAMRRLWPVGGGLWKRRMHEATLFAKGLMSPPALA